MTRTKVGISYGPLLLPVPVVGGIKSRTSSGRRRGGGDNVVVVLVVVASVLVLLQGG